MKTIFLLPLILVSLQAAAQFEKVDREQIKQQTSDGTSPMNYTVTKFIAGVHQLLHKVARDLEIIIVKKPVKIWLTHPAH